MIWLLTRLGWLMVEAGDTSVTKPPKRAPKVWPKVPVHCYRCGEKVVVEVKTRSVEATTNTLIVQFERQEVAHFCKEPPLRASIQPEPVEVRSASGAVLRMDGPQDAVWAPTADPRRRQ